MKFADGVLARSHWSSQIRYFRASARTSRRMTTTSITRMGTQLKNVTTPTSLTSQAPDNSPSNEMMHPMHNARGKAMRSRDCCFLLPSMNARED
jgi:hypothetical protein